MMNNNKATNEITHQTASLPTMEPKWTSNPHLTKFHLTADRQPTIDKFFQLNPQIEILKLYHCFHDMSIARILQHLPHLQDLNIQRSGYKPCENEDKIHISRLKHLKRLRIRSFFPIETVSFILQALLDGNVQLETLILRYLDVDEIIDAVCKMQGVTKLEMDHVNAQHIIRLIGEMQKLNEIIFESSEINYEVIRDALKITPNSMKATFVNNKMGDNTGNIEPLDMTVFEEIDTIRRERNIELIVKFVLPINAEPEHVPVPEVSSSRACEEMHF